MTTRNPHIGSSFESWLDETGFRDDVTAAAISATLCRQQAKAVAATDPEGDEPMLLAESITGWREL